MPEVIVADVPVRYDLLGPQAKLLFLKVHGPKKKFRTLDPVFNKKEKSKEKQKRKTRSVSVG